MNCPIQLSGWVPSVAADCAGLPSRSPELCRTDQAAIASCSQEAYH